MRTGGFAMRVSAVNDDRNHEDRKLWTVFEPLAGANEASCTKSCEENLDCLTSFPGYHGCFSTACLDRFGLEICLSAFKCFGWCKTSPFLWSRDSLRETIMVALRSRLSTDFSTVEFSQLSATPKRGLDLQWSGLAMVFFIQKYENM